VSVDFGAGSVPLGVYPHLYGGLTFSSDDGKVFENVPKLEATKTAFYGPRPFTLRHVNLWGRGVTDEGLQHLRGLAGMRTLNLARTAVSDRGLEHLRGLAGLTWLRLGRTAVTAAGVRRLQEALPQCAVSTEPAISYPKLAAGPWVPVLNREADFPPREGASFTNGTIELTRSQGVLVPSTQGRDMAIRAQVRKLGGQNLGLQLRDAGGWRCNAYFDGGKVFGMGQAKPRFVNFMGVVTPADHNDFFEMTFAAASFG
jgi:hypothetical protein